MHSAFAVANEHHVCAMWMFQINIKMFVIAAIFRYQYATENRCKTFVSQKFSLSLYQPTFSINFLSIHSCIAFFFPTLFLWFKAALFLSLSRFYSIFSGNFFAVWIWFVHGCWCRFFLLPRAAINVDRLINTRKKFTRILTGNKVADYNFFFRSTKRLFWK